MTEAQREKLRRRLNPIKKKIDILEKNGELYIHLKKILQEAEDYMKNDDYDGCDKKIKEFESLKKSKIKVGLGVIAAMLISSLICFFMKYICDNNITINLCTLLSILYILLYNIIIIQIIFRSILLSSETSKLTVSLHAVHLIYIILPIALIGQMDTVNKMLCMVVLTLVISICNIIILYKCCKKQIKNHLKYLRYSNMLVSGVFLFIVTLICLFFGSKDTIFTFLFILPLVGLQILYEKVDISVEEEKT